MKKQPKTSPFVVAYKALDHHYGLYSTRLECNQGMVLGEYPTMEEAIEGRKELVKSEGERAKKYGNTYWREWDIQIFQNGQHIPRNVEDPQALLRIRGIY